MGGRLTHFDVSVGTGAGVGNIVTATAADLEHGTTSEFSPCLRLAPELTVAHRYAPTTAPVGEPLTYEVVVTNSGTITATDVVFEDTLPVGSVLGQVTSPGAPCSEMTGTLRCHLDRIHPGDTLTVAITVYPTVAGAIENIARIEGDPDASSRASTSVTGASCTQVEP